MKMAGCQRNRTEGAPSLPGSGGWVDPPSLRIRPSVDVRGCSSRRREPDVLPHSPPGGRLLNAPTSRVRRSMGRIRTFILYSSYITAKKHHVILSCDVVMLSAQSRSYDAKFKNAKRGS